MGKLKYPNKGRGTSEQLKQKLNTKLIYVFYSLTNFVGNDSEMLYSSRLYGNRVKISKVFNFRFQLYFS